MAGHRGGAVRSRRDGCRPGTGVLVSLAVSPVTEQKDWVPRGWPEESGRRSLELRGQHPRWGSQSGADGWSARVSSMSLPSVTTSRACAPLRCAGGGRAVGHGVPWVVRPPRWSLLEEGHGGRPERSTRSFARPRARLGRGPLVGSTHLAPTSMIDLSDGIASDADPLERRIRGRYATWMRRSGFPVCPRGGTSSSVRNGPL